MENELPIPAKQDGSAIPRPKPPLLTVEETKNLSVAQVAQMFCDHINPGQFYFLKLLGFHTVLIDHAEGMYYYDKSGRKILDFFGGFGALAFGHNHPRILSVREQFQGEKRHEIAISFMSQYASALAKNLAAIAPGNLNMVFFASTGSEAVEAALKLAEKFQGSAKSKIVYAEGSFHGKTRGALSVTDSEFYRSTFHLISNTIKIPFGDAKAVETAFAADPSIGAIILETIQGGAGVICAPPKYWKEVRRLCDQYKVLWIADEVQCGVGRSGLFFAFEHAQVVPDIVVMAKSLGGGKAAIGAVISKTPIYMTAYGHSKASLIHGQSTFGGIGETCCTAIEALNILYDEGLMENCTRQGNLLISELFLLKNKHPKTIKEIRGQGLMVGIEFHDFSHTLPASLKYVISLLDQKLKGSLCGFIGSLLMRDHQILVAFTEYNRNVIRLEPPLIVTEDEIMRFIHALDEILSRGIVKIIGDYTKSFFIKDSINKTTMV